MNDMNKEIINDMMADVKKHLDGIQWLLDDGIIESLHDLSFANIENAVHAYSNAQSYMIYLMKQQRYVPVWLAEMNVELIKQAIRLQSYMDDIEFQYAIESEDGMLIGPATLDQFRLMHWDNRVATLTVVSNYFCAWASQP